ncbi:uncharacterized protein [Neodiprion pinetum]|uniref:uncharacterized protein n=1 Tax=Neodiprion pinetum TaxID=441929 RepID=UPI0037121102
MSSSSGGGGFGVGVGVAGGPGLAAAQQGQGVAALLVMLAVLCFIFAYCCWGAPFCRSLCKKHCCCRLEDPEPDPRFGSTDQAMVATPTIILLPHGRMLVVDGTVFTQFQADTTGLDLVELGESVIRAQRNPRSLNRHQLRSSQGSIMEMDAETPSKESLGSLGGCFAPPTYESIYGKDEGDMPPSYSDILLHRFGNLPYELDVQEFAQDGKEEIEMQTLETRPRVIENPANVQGNNFYYGGIGSFSTPNFPQQNVTRNPTLTDNPLDEYYADVNLDAYTISTGMIGSHGYDREVEGNYVLRNEGSNESFRNIVHNETEIQISDRQLDVSSLSYVNENLGNNSAGVAESSRNRYSSPSSDARYDHRPVFSEPGSSDEGEPAGDFGTLPDIRESRV